MQSIVAHQCKNAFCSSSFLKYYNSQKNPNQLQQAYSPKRKDTRFSFQYNPNIFLIIRKTRSVKILPNFGPSFKTKYLCNCYFVENTFGNISVLVDLATDLLLNFLHWTFEKARDTGLLSLLQSFRNDMVAAKLPSKLRIEVSRGMKLRITVYDVSR